MTVADYKPGAMTPLYDSIGKAIAHADAQAKPGDKVMVMIDTDGRENTSVEYTHESVKALIDDRKSLGWEFLFMANGIDVARAEAVARTGRALGTRTRSSAHARRQMAYLEAAEDTALFFESCPDGAPAQDESK